MTTLLIDGDIVLWRCAASAENENLDIAILRTDSMMREILEQGEDYLVFLSGTNNFRNKINPDYKANRRGKPKPKYFEDCGKYLIEMYNAEITDGYEADDALGIHQKEGTVICSIDKDLLQIPGINYNFVTKEYKEISKLEGLQSFYRQMLIGDSSDNIFGVKGVGKVKAAKLIDNLTTEDEMYKLVFDLYEKETFECLPRFLMNADCLWIMRKEGEIYTKRDMADQWG